MARSPFGADRQCAVRSAGPIGLGVEVDDARVGIRGDLRTEIRFVGRLVARVANREALLVNRLECRFIFAVHGLLQLRQLAVLECFQDARKVDVSARVILADGLRPDRPLEVGLRFAEVEVGERPVFGFPANQRFVK